MDFLDDEMSSGVDHITVDGVKYMQNILPRSIFEGRKEVNIRVLMGKLWFLHSKNHYNSLKKTKN